MSGARKPLLTFYFRHGCHLCDDMWQQLEEVLPPGELPLKRVDVDSSPELCERFGTLVPVLAAGSEILCSYYLDPRALDRFLRQSRDGPE